MALPAPAAMDWPALYAHLVDLRAELAQIKNTSPVDVQRYRNLRQRIGDCITEITRYHKRAAEERDAPPRRSV